VILRSVLEHPPAEAGTEGEMTREFIRSERIAYFTMEIALRADIPTYSGGLGVLADWWAEGRIEGVTGWGIGDGGPEANDAAALYDKLEQVVPPLFYGDPNGWISVMKGAITKNASFFNSHRMMRRYASDAYVL
jgi:glucan phosphorylase